MGATDFYTRASGASAQEAFRAAREEAQHEHGHGGYSGTIAEKSEFVTIPLPEGIEASAYAEMLIDKQDKRVWDKWGPAGCFDLGGGQYYFFGIASS